MSILEKIWRTIIDGIALVLIVAAIAGFYALGFAS